MIIEDNFKLHWTLWVGCAYFKVENETVSKKQQPGNMATIRQAIQYLLYQNGATYQKVAEMTHCAIPSARSNVLKVAGLIEDTKLKYLPIIRLSQDVRNLLMITNQN